MKWSAHAATKGVSRCATQFKSARLPSLGRVFLVALWLDAAIGAPAQTLTTLRRFDGSNGGQPAYVTLAQGRDGMFYGTTPQFGGHGGGTVFRVSSRGALTKLASFAGPPGPRNPYAGLVLATDGELYGATKLGGSHKHGTVFKISSNGALNTLYSFCSKANCGDGAYPQAKLVQATDGNLYGTTFQGGANNGGTIFTITPSGKLKTLYSFCSQTNCTDGRWPLGAGLLQGTDGNFYGTTSSAGTSFNGGTIFRFTLGGSLTTLYSFCPEIGCHDGSTPYGTLVQATDGNFYGTTHDGGANGYGTVFTITPTGSLTTLHDFCSKTDCADGYGPWAGLVKGTDGSFYGTTQGGGSNTDGTIFKITPAGELTTLYSFCTSPHCSDGVEPIGGLVQGTDGKFYGTTHAGGKGSKCSGGCGTVYSFSMGFDQFVAFVQDSGRVGARVEILGQGFIGTSGVLFNGTAAAFVVHSDTYLTTTVPQGATTGPVTVTTPSGTLTSNVPFRVSQ